MERLPEWASPDMMGFSCVLPAAMTAPSNPRRRLPSCLLLWMVCQILYQYPAAFRPWISTHI